MRADKVRGTTFFVFLLIHIERRFMFLSRGELTLLHSHHYQANTNPIPHVKRTSRSPDVIQAFCTRNLYLNVVSLEEHNLLEFSSCSGLKTKAS
jgi:hypothetical protein